MREPENTSAARTFDLKDHKTKVNNFFQNLETVYLRYKFTPDKIYNVDESGITTVLNTPKVLADKTQKQVGQLASAGDLVTFGGIICARVHHKEHFLEGAPGSVGVAARSGWINGDIFLDVRAL